MNIRFNQNYLQVLFLFLALCLVYWIYQPGIYGSFLFDDFPNLEELGTYGGVVDWETFKNFVLNGIAGPTGRPISLASFLLDDNTWPSYPQLFKITNIKIHLLTGLALVLATLNLLRFLKFSESKAAWLAVISASIWMLHPYMVSTTLYVVQRMAQLATMFMFFGVALYFYGRQKLELSIRAGYLWMTTAITGFTILATLSKENGILLPVTILVIESCVPVGLCKKLDKRWCAIFLWLPTTIIAIYLLSLIQFSLAPLPNRGFSQYERLLTEPRIIWEYLFHLYVPRIEGRGLFHDGYNISHGLFDPAITSIALIGLAVFIGVIVKFRRKYPLLAIAFLFFFANHLLESTTVNLELYFEHRNYSASAFLFLPIIVFLMNLPIDRKLITLSVGLMFAALIFLTRERVLLWSDGNKLEAYWAVATPNSPRARNRMGVLLLQQNQIEKAKAYFAQSIELLPDSALLNFNYLLVKVYIREAKEEDFLLAGQRLESQPFDAQAVKALRSLVEKVTSIDNKEHYVEYTLTLLENVNKNPRYSNFSVFQRLYFYLKGRLFLKLEERQKMVDSFNQAIDLYADTDAALSMVAEVANAGFYEESMELLSHTKRIYQNQSLKDLKRSRSLYDKEIQRIGDTLELALKSQRGNGSGP